MGSHYKMLRWSPSDKLKERLSRIGLYFGLIFYTAIGAKVFQELESGAEYAQKEKELSELLEKRTQLLKSVTDKELTEYEIVLAEAASVGVTAADQNITSSWGFVQSVFFSTTILTTIGYGNISPTTLGGRLFCIFFAIIGIPFTLSVLADLGILLAYFVKSIISQYNKRLKPLLRGGKSPSVETERKDLEEVGVSENIGTIAGSLFFFFFFLSIGAILFSIKEGISFFDAFYFCFITMTTIGFGDIVPTFENDSSFYMLLSTLYILIGMTGFTAIIETLREQSEESWKKMQRMKIQIQAQVKLVDTLSKAASQGKLDEAGKKELVDLKASLAIHRRRLGKRFDEIVSEEIEWMTREEKKFKVVAVILYETSL